MALRETPRHSNALRTLRGTLWNRSTPRTLRRSVVLRVLRALRGAPRRSAALRGAPRRSAYSAALRGAPRRSMVIYATPWHSMHLLAAQA